MCEKHSKIAMLAAAFSPPQSLSVELCGKQRNWPKYELKKELKRLY